MADVPLSILTKPVAGETRRQAIIEGGSQAAASRMSLWLPVALYMALIFGLSSIAETPEMSAGSDKALHTVLYAGLGVLLARAGARGWRGVSMRIVAISACVGALYGASDELHQYFNPPRTVEAGDVLADTIGTALGAGALYAWGIIRGRDGV